MAHILVVDDEKATADLLAAVLLRDGHEVVTAGNGQEGLNAVAKKKPDLVLSDITMPIMDGYTFVSQLAADEATRSVPVIVLTGKDALLEPFQMLGNVTHYFVKPFDVKLVRARVAEVLTPRAQA